MSTAREKLAARTKQNETDIEVLTALRLAGGGGGVTAHNALTGLAADDHTQYHNDARGDARYDPLGAAAAAAAASQPLDSDLTSIAALSTTAFGRGLLALADAAALGASHDHVAADITDFDTQVRTSRLDQMATAGAAVQFAGYQGVGLALENRTSDPGSPSTGQIWLRTDL